MVHFTSLFGAAALLSGFANALPRPDSAIGGEVAVSAPNGIIMSDTAELYSQLATAAGAETSTSSAAYATATAPPSYGSSGSYGYGASPPSYDSMANNGGYNQYQSSSSSQVWTTSSAVYTPPSYTTTSSSAYQTYSMPSYGSGNSNWGNDNPQYNDCVQKCLASYTGLPAAATYTPTATNTPPAGTGATHTVIVAPTQGVLRYIPFAVNASVGDTIKFMWGANNHTVTKSSSLLPCNRTADALFTSGTQNQGFVFTQVVNDTNPTFFYCATPTHCQKGMFGIINPPSALGASTSVGQMMPQLAANYSNVAAYSAYTAQQTVRNPQAGKWGSGIDMSSMPEWAQQYVAENVLYTQNFIASNPEVLKEDGSIDLTTSDSTPLMIPQDLSAAIAAGSSTTPGSSSTPSAAAATGTDAPASTGTPASQTGGAMASVASPKVLTTLAIALGAFLML